MALLDKILGSLTDDKGLFRGGKYGRVLGRTKDALGLKPGQRALERDYKITTHRRDNPNVGEEGPMRPEKSDRFSQVGNRLNFMVENFDPTDNKSVLKLQRAMNANGFDLKEDGMFGKKTLAAVRKHQAMRDKINQSYDPVTEEVIEEYVGDGPYMSPAGNPGRQY
tara:strand:- start:2619 stop:3116 length:498 start_codon:yes stop_codon:yes gene_type:complete